MACALLLVPAMDDRNLHVAEPSLNDAPLHAAQQRTVLILEDDRTTRLMLAATVANAGYRVLQAARVEEARRILAEQAPDLLIVDGLLPDGTGLDFITELRS